MRKYILCDFDPSKCLSLAFSLVDVLCALEKNVSTAIVGILFYKCQLTQVGLYFI